MGDSPRIVKVANMNHTTGLAFHCSHKDVYIYIPPIIVSSINASLFLHRSIIHAVCLAFFIVICLVALRHWKATGKKVTLNTN